MDMATKYLLTSVQVAERVEIQSLYGKLSVPDAYLIRTLISRVGKNKPFHPHFQHRHSSFPDIQQTQCRDLGMLGALIHVMGDAINNLGVIMAALLIWLLKSDARFYADPGVSVGIAIMIILSSVPLIKNSGEILLESAPKGVRTEDIKHDIEKVCHSQTKKTRTTTDFLPREPASRSRFDPRAARLETRSAQGHRLGPRRPHRR